MVKKTMKKRHVVIFGYYGRGNLGDETNLRELVGWLRRNFPGIWITVISGDPVQTATAYGVATVGRFQWRRIRKALLKADLLIGGGGTLFQDRTSLRSLLYYSALIGMAKFYRVPVFLYGQGIGPVESRLGKLVARGALSAVDMMTVRDRLSVIALAELRVHRPEVYFTAEPLLALPPPEPAAVASRWEHWPQAVRIGLILKADVKRKEFWKEIISHLKWKPTVSVFLIVMDPADLAFNIELASVTDAELIDDIENWEQFQQLLGGIDLLLSMRLHGLIAAAVGDIPCCGLSDDPKIDGFCLQWGIPFVALMPEMDQVALCNRIISMLEASDEERKPWSGQRESWLAKAKENQAILKRALEHSR